MSKLHEEIRAAINRSSAENGSDTPDFILAEYLVGCLAAYDKAVTAREKWYGRECGGGAAIVRIVDLSNADRIRADAWVEVSQEVFDRYIKEYPNRLDKDIARMCEPPILNYNDFSQRKVWPQSIVAKVQLYDGSEYHGGRGPVYFLPNVRDDRQLPAASRPETKFDENSG